MSPDTTRILIAEDDLVSRKLLEGLLAPIGRCDAVENGRLAVDRVIAGYESGQPYHLICLDIMMPVMDGQAALCAIRDAETERGLYGLSRSKVVMTTALDDNQNILTAFRSQCEVYLVKPIDDRQLYRKLRQLGFRTPPEEP